MMKTGTRPQLERKKSFLRHNDTLIAALVPAPEPSRPPCQQCGQVTPPESTIALGPHVKASFCAKHFCCYSCEELIPLGATFTVRHNMPFCADCTASLRLPVCHLCHLEIGGDVVEAMGTTFHPDHFLCTTCHIPLTDQFDQSTYYTANNLPYCEADYLRLFEVDESEASSDSSKGSAVTLLQPAPRRIGSSSSPSVRQTTSPFASPEPPRRRRAPNQLHVQESRLARSSSPDYPSVPRQVSKLRAREGTLHLSGSRSRSNDLRAQLEPEKRGSFIMKKETREEYVRVKTSLTSFHSHSAAFPLDPSTSRSSLQVENEHSTGLEDHVELLHVPEKIKKTEQEEVAIGKRLMPISTLVDDITKYLQFNTVVGKGGFATVREGVDLKTNEPVAVKIFNKWELKDEVLIFIQREVETLAKLSHPNIRQFRHLYEDSHYLYVVMEYIHGESLYDYVERMEKLSERKAKIITRNVLEVLAYMHGEGFIHQDIKTENILLPHISENGGELELEKMKVIDFGFCRPVGPSEKLREYCGSYHYMAPEMIKREPYALPVDLWSVGVFLYILMSGLRPFFSQEEAAEAKIQWFEEDWEELSPEVRQLVVALLNPDAEKRLTAEQALQHPWFALED